MELTATMDFIPLIAKGYTLSDIRIASDYAQAPVIDYPVLIHNSLLDEVNEMNADNYAIFPNPATSIISVKGNDVQKVVIFNTIGQVVFTQQGNADISVAQFPKGLYFVQIYNSGNSFVTKKIEVK